MDSSETARPQFGAREFSVALVVNLVFALNVVASKVIVGASAPVVAASLRMAVVFLLCLPWFRLVPGRNLALACYGALNGGLYLLVVNVALNIATNIGALALAGQLGVPFSLLLGAVVFREHLSLRKLVGVFLAFAGVALLVFDPHIVDEVGAVLVMALASMIWGGGTLIQRRLSGTPVLTTQAWNGLMGMVLLTPFALIFEPGAIAKIPQASGEAIGWFAFSCLGSTVIGQGALAWLLQRHPIPTVMPLVLASPVIAAAFASFYFGTRITPLMIAGGLVALAGVSLVTLSGTRRV